MCDNPGVVGCGIVLNPAGASTTLTATETDALMDWQDINELKRFVCAFPPDTPEKRPRLG